MLSAAGADVGPSGYNHAVSCVCVSVAVCMGVSVYFCVCVRVCVYVCVSVSVSASVGACVSITYVSRSSSVNGRSRQNRLD